MKRGCESHINNVIIPPEELSGLSSSLQKRIKILLQKNITLSSEAQKNDTLVKNQKIEIEDYKRQIAWFERQLFGAKAERRILTQSDIKQLPLFAQLQTPETPPCGKHTEQTVVSYERKQRNTKIKFVAEDSQLKFTDNVPIETKEILPTEVSELEEGVDYKVVSETISYKLAQRKSPYVVIKYIRKNVKLIETKTVITPPMPEPVFGKSIADVSFLANMVLDKYQSHLPLYRQHQRLQHGGIHLSRSTFTKLIHRVGEVLEPIQKALLSSVLQSDILTIDETPIKAGVNKGKMKRGYFWPLYGQEDEIVFLYSGSRSRSLLDETLALFNGTILCDGYGAYKSFCLNTQRDQEVRLAQCWVHTRRKFFEAEKCNSALATPVLNSISELYKLEAAAAHKNSSLEALKEMRQTHSKVIIESIFEYVSTKLNQEALVPSDPFVKAGKYLLNRKKELSYFIDDPTLPLDTNHIEREIRPVAIGKKNWMFCFTEVGAHISGILYSLVSSCTLAGVDPYTYLVDVLQRIQVHPVKDVHLLTPRLWKEHFQENPLSSILHQ